MAKKILALAAAALFSVSCFLIPPSHAQTPADDSANTPPSDSSPSIPDQATLAQFVSGALKAMGLPDNFSLPGLSDASGMVLENYVKADQNTISAAAIIEPPQITGMAVPWNLISKGAV